LLGLVCRLQHREAPDIVDPLVVPIDVQNLSVRSFGVYEPLLLLIPYPRHHAGDFFTLLEEGREERV
jgi:hypothetical protein